MSLMHRDTIRLHSSLSLAYACATVEVAEDHSSEEEETNEFEDDSHDEDFHLTKKAKPTKRKSQPATHGKPRRTREDLVEGLHSHSHPHTLSSSTSNDGDEAAVHHCPSCNSTRYVSEFYSFTFAIGLPLTQSTY